MNRPTAVPHPARRIRYAMLIHTERGITQEAARRILPPTSDWKAAARDAAINAAAYMASHYRALTPDSQAEAAEQTDKAALYLFAYGGTLGMDDHSLITAAQEASR